MSPIGEMIANNELVEGKDFFVFIDSNYFTVEALMRIYNCSNSNITQKVAKLDIRKKKVFNTWVYKDDVRFEKRKHTGNGFKKGDSRIAKIMSHNEMSILLTKIDKDIQELTSITHDILDHLTRYKTVEEVLGRSSISEKFNKESSLDNSPLQLTRV